MAPSWLVVSAPVNRTVSPRSTSKSFASKALALISRTEDSDAVTESSPTVGGSLTPTTRMGRMASST